MSLSKPDPVLPHIRKLSSTTLALLAFILAAIVMVSVAYGAALIIESRTQTAVTARLFGAQTRPWLRGFFVLTILLFGAAVVLAHAPQGRPLAMAVALAGVWAMGWHITWQMARLDLDDPASCLRAFRANRDAGLIPVPFLAIAAWLG